MKQVLQIWDDGNNSSLMYEITVNEYGGVHIYQGVNPNDIDEKFRYKANNVKLSFNEVKMLIGMIAQMRGVFPKNFKD